MTVVERRVRTLRVRAPDEDRARHAAIVIEDALRTATIPGASSARVIVIRRLDIGAVPVASSSASVSIAVEMAVQRLAADAVHGDSPQAASAPVVYFRDDVEALLALARRLAQARRATEWFWPLVVRGWSPAASPEESAALLLDHALSTTDAPLAMAQLVDVFAATGATDLLLAPLTESQGLALLATIGWSDVRMDAAAPIAPRLPSRLGRVIAWWVDRWGGIDDPRAKWLTAMLLISEHPARAATKGLPAIVGEVLRSVVRNHGEADSRARTATGEMRTLASGESISDRMKRWEERRETIVDSAVGGGPPRPESRAETTAAPNLDAPSPAEHFAPKLPLWHLPHLTAYAGLVFLVPVLSRIGIAELLTERADLVERDWPERFLLRLAYRLGVPADDPVVTWLHADSPAITAADRAVTAAWLRATRARCRRDAGRSLWALTHKSGAIAVTRTHVDVFFQHAYVDIAIRRAGLDIDPGWVSWLGRVVQFHYLDGLPDDAA